MGSLDPLFASWSVWAKAAGEPAGTQKAFAQKLEAHGLRAHRMMHGRGFDGVRLKPVIKA
jgi:putative DNA primase/helicase